jgi:ABC-2 type transport system permease protein
MRVYVEFVKNAFQANIAYRMSVLLRLMSQVVVLAVRVSLWQALFKEIGRTTTPMGVVSVRDMITYSIVSTGMSIIITTNVIRQMDGKIKTGEIAMDLIKPFNLKASLFCDALGTNAVRFFVELLPLLAMGIFIYGLSYPSWQNLILFLIALGNGMLISFSLYYLLGLAGFWYLSVWQFRMTLDILVLVLGGAQIPVWFFPESLIWLSSFMPFKLIYFAPLAIYLEKGTTVDAVGLILQQFLWMGILFALEEFIWSKGVKKLVIQGG